jgi:ER-bound oxygenase mpaB/B'/Rubber oxygenase, catalytic domain
MITPDARPIPRRHGMQPEDARRMARPLRAFIDNKVAAEPDAGRWQRLGEALNEGDKAADALVSWMHQHGMGAARGLFEMVLAKGLQAVPDAPQPLKDFFKHVEQPPVWLDRARLERGVQASYLSGLTGMRVLRDAGLMAGYQAGAINKTLVMTGALEKGAARRIAETTKWRMDCSNEHGMDRFNDGFKNTVRVRMIHALVRKHVASQPGWDAAEWGLPINQVDMQATYLGFSVVYLLGQRIMGTLLTHEEAEDVMHLWRYVGWLMGVNEEWLCSSEQAGRVALYQNILSQAPADESSKQLGRALMDEPLHRHYPRWRWLRQHWNKQVHLSICRLFVGKAGMSALGLPTWVPPWYPVLFAPLNLAWCAVNRLLPGGEARLVAMGRRAQWAQLAVMFGPDQPEILAMGRVKTSA